MPKAVWNGAVIAESDDVRIVDGNLYFPPDALHPEYFQPSETTSVCGRKGTAHYYHIVVDGLRNPDAAWYHPDPKESAGRIRGYVGFWKGVIIHR